mgnify:CR=1 FL=1|jgi:hypothetical protein|tara:strand:- start:771 stop:1172 length:402 start_codon:yes stop_codon:yes gene_type:complete
MSDHEDGFKGFISKSLDLQEIREERNKNKNKSDLLEQAKKRIKTTMIGTLSSLEESFGFLWDFKTRDNASRNEDQIKLMGIYSEARAEILDKGNEQIRLLELDFINYEISRKKYFIKLPVKNAGLDNSKQGED